MNNGKPLEIFNHCGGFSPRLDPAVGAGSAVRRWALPNGNKLSHVTGVNVDCDECSDVI
jgi:hypothetical protein